ncbi:uncharacterized protein EV420DRAFT_1500151 [Desarmillaria tabescens]|uniref:Uncharacterized protein n=1 Tax=Armillaria tabescens TaxID=1929756 RepID=A0AA39NRW5_ARMTA|nr:uncharacterized protein EV420DRAFT_1500151 [Desarmillaria tabescens]KAK0470378.1 hypothetical protein EV420DRAFT_1500151 [Desarmillaria tabescens]
MRLWYCGTPALASGAVLDLSMTYSYHSVSNDAIVSIFELRPLTTLTAPLEDSVPQPNSLLSALTPAIYAIAGRDFHCPSV